MEEYAFGRLALNISGRQFSQPDICKNIEEICKKNGVDPTCLEVEITESSAMQNIEESIKKLFILKKIGMGTAIDDFGTGYSSLTYLQQLPIDRIKIDRSFVRDYVSNPRDGIIVKAIISMSHALGFQVCAEGVETEEQLAFLESIDCDTAQGYFIGKPVSAGERS